MKTGRERKLKRKIRVLEIRLKSNKNTSVPIQDYNDTKPNKSIITERISNNNCIEADRERVRRRLAASQPSAKLLADIYASGYVSEPK